MTPEPSPLPPVALLFVGAVGVALALMGLGVALGALGLLLLRS